MGIKTFMSKLFGGSKPVQDSKPCSCACGKPHMKSEKSEPSAASADRTTSLKDIIGFVEYVVKALVDYPDEVKITSEAKGDSKQINIICRKSDRGKIIGKKGKTIIALRALVAGAAGRMQDRVMIEVIDDEDPAVKD